MVSEVLIIFVSNSGPPTSRLCVPTLYLLFTDTLPKTIGTQFGLFYLDIGQKRILPDLTDKGEGTFFLSIS